MKIAVCLKIIQPRDGTSHFAMQLGQMLADAGHDVTMVAEQVRSLDLRNSTPGLSYITIHQHRWESKSRHIYRIGDIFHEQRFHVVFICAGLPVPDLERAFALLPDGTALVPILGGDREHVYEPTQRTAALWNVTVAESPRLQQTIQARTPGKPVRLLTTGIKHPSDAELAERLPLSVPLRLLFVGRLAGGKNVLMLPKVLAACIRRGLPSTLTICGYGRDRGPLEQACYDEGVAHLVEFPEIPFQAGLYRAYRSHHVSLLTSKYHGEGLGLVLLEAQANGCVPVASRLPGVTDFTIEEGVTGLLAEVGNPDSFADQIVTMADPERWHRFSRAGVARTRRLFTLEEMEREYGGLLKELHQGIYALSTPRSRLPRPHFRQRDYVPLMLNSIVDRLYHAAKRFRTSNPE